MNNSARYDQDRPASDCAAPAPWTFGPASGIDPAPVLGIASIDDIDATRIAIAQMADVHGVDIGGPDAGALPDMLLAACRELLGAHMFSVACDAVFSSINERNAQ